MNDLDSEDGKKDTVVDVVFKKALKEFRQNIFSFYSSALAVSCSKGSVLRLRMAKGPPVEALGSLVAGCLPAG